MHKKGNIEVHTQNIFPIIKKWLYSDKDIFLRELVSNACDAISKLKVLRNMGQAEQSDEQPIIKIDVDKDAKTITISDNGIGMTTDEIERYINQVAFSGAEEFIEKYKDKGEDSQIIGHFGLGFYSAFMVSTKVTIDTKSYTDAPAAFWECDGGTEFEMSEGKRDTIGTTITLYIDDESDSYLQAEKVRGTLLKYCNFLPYDIILNGEEHSVNTKDPLWTKSPSKCTHEEYVSFYHKLFSDFNDPLFYIHLNVEYPFNLSGILYFPKLTHEFESAQGQIKLYNNQVFVAENIKEVTPEFLMLLKGVIDCPDLPLNVSRSFLQNDGYVTKVSQYITRKVADKLISLANTERDKFNEFWGDISPFIEYGCLNNEDFFGKVSPILQAKTINGDYVTLDEYANTHDKKFTYVTSETSQASYINIFKEEGKDAIIMPHLIDLHFITFLESKKQWEFTRIDADTATTHDDSDLSAIFESIIDKEKAEVKSGTISSELPAIIMQNEQQRRMSDTMKLFGGQAFPTKSTLVLNKNSEVIKKLTTIEDKEKQTLVASLVYDLARICHGSMESKDMADYVKRATQLLNQF